MVLPAEHRQDSLSFSLTEITNSLCTFSLQQEHNSRHPTVYMLTHFLLTIFLLLFMFFISLMHHHHPALLHRHALIMDQLLTYSMLFSTLVLKLSLPQSLSFHSHLLPAQFISWNLTTRYLAVTGGGSVGECGRLSQPSWILGTL